MYQQHTRNDQLQKNEKKEKPITTPPEKQSCSSKEKNKILRESIKAALQNLALKKLWKSTTHWAQDKPLQNRFFIWLHKNTFENT